MRRSRLTVNTVLRLLRIAALMKQQEVAAKINVDQSTVSRIESEDLSVTAEIEVNYVMACGGNYIVDLLINRLRELQERVQQNRFPLLPA